MTLLEQAASEYRDAVQAHQRSVKALQRAEEDLRAATSREQRWRQAENAALERLVEVVVSGDLAGMLTP